MLQGGGMSPGAVSVGHLVVFDEKELQLLIIANSEYNLDVEGDVGTTQWQLREGALEKHVVERSVFACITLSNIRFRLGCVNFLLAEIGRGGSRNQVYN